MGSITTSFDELPQDEQELEDEGFEENFNEAREGLADDYRGNWGSTAIIKPKNGLQSLQPVDPLTGQLLRDAAGRLPVFFEIRALTFGAVMASMIAYLSAQFCDVFLFHFLKRLTDGKHLWVRNNGSTLVSQLVDTLAVILITHFYAGALPIDPGMDLGKQLAVYIASGYLFKATAALFDTIPCYLAVHFLSRYLRITQDRPEA